MILQSSIFKSAPHSDPEYGPWFKGHSSIQSSLAAICQSWATYLKAYAKETERLFGEPELPWMLKEGPVVSTLLASISRRYRNSVSVLELPVKKRGLVKAGNRTGHGLCDAWISVPELRKFGGDFNLYLEAKILRELNSTQRLRGHLSGKYGIDKLFCDYQTSSGKRIRLTSPYTRKSGRVHDHFVVGLMVVPIHAASADLPAIKKQLAEVFGQRKRIQVRNANARVTRRLPQFPTVALILVDQDGRHPGMIASFTVLGSTSELLAKSALATDSLNDAP